MPAAKVPVFTAMALISLEGGGRGGGGKGGKDRVALVTNFVVAAGDDGLLHFHDSDGNLLKTHPTGHREGVRVVTLVYTGTQVNPVIVTGGEDGSLLRHDMTVWIDSRYVEGRCVEGRCVEGRCVEGRCVEGRCGEERGRGGEKRRERGREKGGRLTCVRGVSYICRPVSSSNVCALILVHVL